MCFPMNIAKFLRTPILKNICEWLLLNSVNLKKGLKEKQVTKSRHIVNYMKEFKMYKLYGIFLLRDVTVFYLNMHIYFIFTVSEFFIGNIDGELSHISK